MSTIPNNLLEIANDAWLTLPYGVRDILKQSNWVAGFCEGYKSQLATDGREEDKNDLSWRADAIKFGKERDALQSSLKEKDGRISGLVFACEQWEKKYDALENKLEELKAENERLKGLIEDAYTVGYDNSSFAHDSNLQEQYDPPQTWQQFKTENNL